MNLKSLKAMALAAVMGIVVIASAQDDMTTTTTTVTTQDASRGMITGFDSRISSLPLFEKNVFQNLLNNLSDDQDTLVTKTLFAVEDKSAADKTALGEMNTLDMLVDSAGTDGPAFRSMYDGLAFEFQQTILTLGRDAILGGFADEPAVDKAIASNTTSTYEATTIVDQDSGTVVRNQTDTMAVAPAATFAALPLPEKLAIDGAMTQIPRENHVFVVNMLSKITNDGSAGSSMGWQEAKDIMAKNSDSGFDTLWNSLSWEQQHILVTLTRDAYYGGLGDM